MIRTLFAVLASVGLASSAFAAEYPIGQPHDLNGLEIGAVYLQPIEMEPAGMMRPAQDSDIHLEADIHATADNKNGLPEGAWAPYLNIQYVLQKKGSNKLLKGDLMPMVANDGPHYGDNVKLEGPGKYQVTFVIGSPDTAPGNHFGRHVDKETGVAPWFKTFEVKYDFVYAGTGKKGGY
ncbi:MAG TPA: iron transporter [Castellaniella sp.]|uniref:iron transporter n=1 Tax=Castellaniella sp. TaxID=1955812 RepID=UPI002F0A126C